MFSEFCMGPAASGRGLCDSGRVVLRVTKAHVKKWNVQAQRKYTDHNCNLKSKLIGTSSSCKDFPISRHVL